MKHIVLLYDYDSDLDVSIADYLNAGPKRNQFCVLASVHVRDKGFAKRFSLRIADYKENIKKGNLLIVDLAPFYIAAMIGDMKPFEEARKIFEEKARERDDKHVKFVGDGTRFLFKNRHFDECSIAIIEKVITNEIPAVRTAMIGAFVLSDTLNTALALLSLWP